MEHALVFVSIIIGVAVTDEIGTLLAGQAVEWVFVALMVSLAVVRRRWWHAVGLALLTIGPLHWLLRSLG